MARKAKYSEEWRHRAAALQTKIEEAMTLATSSIGDYRWLHRLHSWVTGHCCKVSDEAAFCLIQRPYISKTLLTRRISPRGSP